MAYWYSFHHFKTSSLSFWLVPVTFAQFFVIYPSYSHIYSYFFVSNIFYTYITSEIESGIAERIFAILLYRLLCFHFVLTSLCTFFFYNYYYYSILYPLQPFVRWWRPYFSFHTEFKDTTHEYALPMMSGIPKYSAKAERFLECTKQKWGSAWVTVCYISLVCPARSC